MENMETMAMAEVRENLAETVNRVAFGKTRISLTRKNKPVAYMIPVEDMELLEALEDRLDILAIEGTINEIEVEGTTSLEELKKGL